MNWQGGRTTVHRNKYVLPNHIVYNPTKEEQRDSYYYSLLLLFVEVPFFNMIIYVINF